MQKAQLEKLLKFLSEIQMLKRVKREGPWLAGVENSMSVATHSALSAQIAYVLGRLEGVDAAKCAVINLFHDNEEIRTSDRHRIAKMYLDFDKAEQQAEKDHYANLPQDIADELFGLQEEFRAGETKEAVVAKDADYLECAIQAKLYLEQGYQGMQLWIENVGKALQTDSARDILAAIKEVPNFTTYWWQSIGAMYRKVRQES